MVITLGLYIRRSGLVPEAQWEGINSLAYWLFFPALVLDILINADLNSIPLTGVTMVFLLTTVTLGVLSISAWPFLKAFLNTSGPVFSSLFQTSNRWNAFIALAIVAKLYGEDSIAVVAVAMAVVIPLVNFESVLVLNIFASKHKLPIQQMLLNVFKNPLLVASLVGISLNLAAVPIYQPLLTTLDIVGRPALGVGILAVGAGLRIRYLYKPSAVAVFAVVMKLLAVPLVVFFWCLVFSIEGEVRMVALVCASVPTAMNGYILALKLGGDAELYASIATLQTLVSAITIPLVLWAAAVF